MEWPKLFGSRKGKMLSRMHVGLIATGALTMLGRVSCFAGSGPAPTYSMAPSTMARIGSIDERFQSYNIEMVEVTGGRFWMPYASKAEATPAASKQPSSNQPAGMDPGLYQYRQPINLANPRLRRPLPLDPPIFASVVRGLTPLTSRTPTSPHLLPRQRASMAFSPASNGKELSTSRTRQMLKLSPPLQSVRGLATPPVCGPRNRRASFLTTPNPPAATSPPPNT